MRTKTEIKLLNLRQSLRETLERLRSLPVTPLQEYRRAWVAFQVCETALTQYRQEFKFKDIA